MYQEGAQKSRASGCRRVQTIPGLKFFEMQQTAGAVISGNAEDAEEEEALTLAWLRKLGMRRYLGNKEVRDRSFSNGWILASLLQRQLGGCTGRIRRGIAPRAGKQTRS